MKLKKDSREGLKLDRPSIFFSSFFCLVIIHHNVFFISIVLEIKKNVTWKTLIIQFILPIMTI